MRSATTAAALAAALAPGIGQAQVSGQAAALRATVLGVVTSVADSGTLSDPSQPVGTGQTLGSIPGLASAESLHSAAMGWSDQVASEASLSNVALTVAGTGITADFVQSRALAVAGAAGSGLTAIEGLTIGGLAISPTGIPNQMISLPGLSVILNEQTQTASGFVVNALRVRTLDGTTDVVLGSARAGI
ncbi:MAG: choice-of-anchor P family protein [Burkholderiales bacterium]